MSTMFKVYEFSTEMPLKVSLTDEWSVLRECDSEPRVLAEFSTLEEAKACFDKEYSRGQIYIARGFSGLKFRKVIFYCLVENGTRKISKSCDEYVEDFLKISKFPDEQKNIKIVFSHTMEFDLGKPNCGFSDYTDSVIVENNGDEPLAIFKEWLELNSVYSESEKKSKCLFVLDDDEENRTGEAYRITGIEYTLEDCYD